MHKQGIIITTAANISFLNVLFMSKKKGEIDQRSISPWEIMPFPFVKRNGNGITLFF
jgi:hypothetical protein